MSAMLLATGSPGNLKFTMKSLDLLESIILLFTFILCYNRKIYGVLPPTMTWANLIGTANILAGVHGIAAIVTRRSLPPTPARETMKQ